MPFFGRTLGRTWNLADHSFVKRCYSLTTTQEHADDPVDRYHRPAHKSRDSISVAQAGEVTREILVVHADAALVKIINADRHRRHSIFYRSGEFGAAAMQEFS
jgi:hypothetical protein